MREMAFSDFKVAVFETEVVVHHVRQGHTFRGVDYFHIELETHEVVFAEGAPAETLLVTNGREHFANFVDYERRYEAEAVRPAMKPFAPVLEYRGAGREFERLLRMAVSPVFGVRDPTILNPKIRSSGDVLGQNP